MTLDDCYRFSKQLEFEFELLEKLQGKEFEPYSLEVSSPGAKRPLIRDSHFKRFIGRKVEILLHTPIDSEKQKCRKRWKGVLMQRTPETTVIRVNIEDGCEELILENSRIKKATLIPRLPW
ncbi:ribosome maturation factor RimP [Candidatus Riflebacteria bacterium]